jgi:hypothetical protein
VAVSGSDLGGGAATGAGKKKRHWGLIAVVVLIIIPALVFTLYTASTLGFSYAKGERAGYVQKLSQKGWLCKTWEGQLAMATMPGVAPQMFDFTVRSDSVAQAIQGLMGKRVALSYTQHKGVPTSCFGETEYYVEGVKVDSMQ